MTIRVWHYTVATRLVAIVASKELRLATTSTFPGQRAVVWFSTTPTWEESANKAAQRPGEEPQRITTEDMQRLMGLARIEVDPAAAPLTWNDYKQRYMSGPPLRDAARAYESLALEWGARPDEWRVSLKPVPIRAWRMVEVWNGKQWTPRAF
jgi:hypothetical protein